MDAHRRRLARVLGFLSTWWVVPSAEHKEHPTTEGEIAVHCIEIPAWSAAITCVTLNRDSAADCGREQPVRLREPCSEAPREVEGYAVSGAGRLGKW